MNINHLAIGNIDQVSVGDKVFVVNTNYTQTTSIRHAEVTRVLKTKFELTSVSYTHLTLPTIYSV